MESSSRRKSGLGGGRQYCTSSTRSEAWLMLLLLYRRQWRRLGLWGCLSQAKVYINSLEFQFCGKQLQLSTPISTVTARSSTASASVSITFCSWIAARIVPCRPRPTTSPSAVVSLAGIFHTQCPLVLSRGYPADSLATDGTGSARP